jgi:hypothetical protein
MLVMKVFCKITVLSGKIAGSIFEFNDVNLKKGVYFLSIKSSIVSANKRVIIN